MFYYVCGEAGNVFGEVVCGECKIMVGIYCGVGISRECTYCGARDCREWWGGYNLTKVGV